MNWIELIGYIASTSVVASFLINNNIKLTRSINLCGCILFTIYGFLINSIPIIIPNAFLIFVQLYFLFFNSSKK